VSSLRDSARFAVRTPDLGPGLNYAAAPRLGPGRVVVHRLVELIGDGSRRGNDEKGTGEAENCCVKKPEDRRNRFPVRFRRSEGTQVFPPVAKGTSKSGLLWTYQVAVSRPFPLIPVVQKSSASFQKDLKDSCGGCGAGTWSSETLRWIDSLLDGCKPNDLPLSRNLKVRKQARLSGDEMDDRSEQPQAWKLDDTSFGTTSWVCDAKQ
jgi:hypothetical protein